MSAYKEKALKALERGFTRLTVHILPAVAQHEREMIAQRTKDALKAAKTRGVVLGNPRLADVRDRAVASVKADGHKVGVGTVSGGSGFLTAFGH
jgi:DNA invertase Pin-like site-specific DNA recombinase